jgi:hypothetical protein
MCTITNAGYDKILKMEQVLDGRCSRPSLRVVYSVLLGRGVTCETNHQYEAREP